MPELIFSHSVKGSTSAFFIDLEVKHIIRHLKNYRDMMALFGDKYTMPPEEAYASPDEHVYRCPYIPDCPRHKHCFALATPAPVGSKLMVNIKCELCEGQKIPVYIAYANKMKK